MHPRLEAISGSPKGEIFPLPEDSVSIGSATSSHISVNDVLVSPRHYLVKKKGEHLEVWDLGFPGQR